MKKIPEVTIMNKQEFELAVDSISDWNSSGFLTDREAFLRLISLIYEYLSSQK